MAKRKLLSLTSLVLATAVGGALVFACSDSTSTATTTDAGGADVATGSDTGTTTGDIAVTAVYGGTKTGPVILVVFKNFPPGAMDLPVATGSIEKPTFPGSNMGTINGVAPGNYFIVSYILTGADTPDHRMGPQAGDPQATPTPVTVTAGKSTSVTLMYGEAPVDDGGADAGDAADAADAPNG